MPWRHVTLVPYRQSSVNGSSAEASPVVEVASESPNLLQSPLAFSDQDDLNQVDSGNEALPESQFGDIGSGELSLPDELDPVGRLGDFRANLAFDESVRGTSVFEEQ